MFRRFAYSLSRFMAGRNGMDYFGYCLWWFYLILFVIQLIVSLFSQIAGLILSILLWVLLFYMLFRMFSRNLPARSRENIWWGQVWSKTPFGKKGSARFNGFRGYGQGYGPGRSAFGQNDYTDYTANPPKSPKKKKVKLPKDKDHVYRICPACRANIRLPKKKGVHSVRCPRCAALFEVKI